MSKSVSKKETPKPQKSDDVEWDEDLNAEEINDILGFNLSEEMGEDRSGLKALINSALVSPRRLPMLDVVFDRSARQMTTSLRHLTNDNVEVTLDDVSATRFGEFLHSLPTPVAVGVVKAHGLDNYCLLAVDAPLVYSIVDLLLGGKRGGSVLAIEDRGFTQIELSLTQRVLQLMIDDLTAAFSSVADVTFSLDRMETTPRFAAIAQDASVCSLAKFRIDIEDRGGRAVLLTPHATLEPIYKVLLRDFIGEASGNENVWRDHLAAEIEAAKLDLKVVLAEKEIAIAELDALQLGQTIRFRASSKAPAEIRAGDAVIARGHIGKSGEMIAIRLIDGAERHKEEAA